MPSQHFKYLDDLKNHMSVQTLEEHVFRIEKTKKTPLIYLDSKEGIIVIYGWSIPENSIAFYKPAVSFLRENFEKSEKIRAHVRLGYANSSTSKCLLDILKIHEGYYRTGKDVEVTWYQEDEDPCKYADGLDFQSIIRAPIHVFELDDDEIDEVDHFFAQL